MSDFGLVRGYLDEPTATPPAIGARRMFELALRTWPYMRPMLKHLLVLGMTMLAGGAAGLIGAFVGTDLLTNKVLVGQKLQPVQATVLFVGEDYVTRDGEQLGNGSGDNAGGSKADKSAAPKGQLPGVRARDATLDAIEPDLTPKQRRVVRDRLLIWGALGGIFAAVFGSALWYYSTWIWHSINQNLRVAMVERAESLSLRHHDSARVGDAIFRVYQDSSMIINLLQSGIISPLVTLYGVIVGLVIVAAFDPWFALLVVLVAVPVGWVIVRSTGPIRARSVANREAGSNLTSRTQEVFAALRVVKANSAEQRVFERFDHDSIAALDAAYHLRLHMAILSTVVALLGGGMLVFSEYVMVTWVIEERDTFLGAAVAALIGFVAWNYGAITVARGRVEGLANSARGILGIWMRMQDLFIALQRAFELLDLEPEVVDPAHPDAFPNPVERVAWQGVGFSYKDDVSVLRRVDLEARAGTVTAVIGATGSGKSTLMAMLLRLYNPDTGSVRINDADIRNLASDDLKANVAIALQKNVLFAETVANNIAFGVGTPSRQEIVAAATVAGANEFIEELPKGYDTELGERGGKLSAGQRQRLSIARAVVRNTPILILDEPTASLDARTERQVLANLRRWGAGRVIFLITHRLSTIRDADRIALVEDGSIAESGSHDELITREGGRYRAFVEAEMAGTAFAAAADARGQADD